MSKTRYKWWSYVCWMVRLYPERVQELRRLQAPSVTPRYGGVTSAGPDVSRPVEQKGMASLGDVVDREVEAVRLAIEQTRTLRNGEDRLRLIDLRYWRRTHTLPGACEACHVSTPTGLRWHREFIRLVAENFGLL